MIPPLPADAAQYKKDTEHLRLLTIFHFIFGGFGVLGVGFLVFHFFIMRMILSNPQIQHQGGPPPEAMIKIFAVIYIILAFFLVAGGLLNIFSAVGIKQRRRRMLSLITAGMNCISFPFGTALGVFTFIVLSRESVKTLYQP
jgi:hypothetical protein